MKRTEVRLSNGENVAAYVSPTTGLTIAKSPATGKWLVTHAASGMYVTACRTRAQAERVAELLRECGAWTRSAHDIVADNRMRACVAREVKRAVVLFEAEDREKAS